MKHMMQKIVLTIVLALNFGSGTPADAAVITMTFANNISPTAAPLPYTISAAGCSSPYTSAFNVGAEFRYTAYDGSECISFGDLSMYTGSGNEQWLFDGITGSMTGTAGFPTNPGASNSPGSAAPIAGTNPTIGQSPSFLGIPYYLLAPTTTSLAGSAYGPATISFNGADNFNVLFPAIEEQWNGNWFAFNNVNFDCTGASSGTFTCFAEHLITTAEDQGAGYAGMVLQWETHGTITPVPAPAALWLFGSGLMVLFGFIQRRNV